MKVSSEFGDFVELEARAKVCGDGDLPLVVRVLRDGFTGEAKTWVERHAWFAFAQELTVLEETLTGEAHVQSMSPGELDLTVRAVGRRGHLGIEGVVGKREFDRKITLRFSLFTFEPSQVAAFVQEARKISEALGSRSR
jgi:hypothetical protein